MKIQDGIKRAKALTLIIDELGKAMEKHPVWPTDQIHAAAILAEEAGETVQAAIDHVYEHGPVAKIRKEAAQAGAMALRVLMNLPDDEDAPGQDHP